MEQESVKPVKVRPQSFRLPEDRVASLSKIVGCHLWRKVFEPVLPPVELLRMQKEDIRKKSRMSKYVEVPEEPKLSIIDALLSDVETMPNHYASAFTDIKDRMELVEKGLRDACSKSLTHELELKRGKTPIMNIFITYSSNQLQGMYRANAAVVLDSTKSLSNSKFLYFYLKFFTSTDKADFLDWDENVKPWSNFAERFINKTLIGVLNTKDKFKYFTGEESPTPGPVNSLVTELRLRNCDIGWKTFANLLQNTKHLKCLECCTWSKRHLKCLMNLGDNLTDLTLFGHPRPMTLSELIDVFLDEAKLSVRGILSVVAFGSAEKFKNLERIHFINVGISQFEQDYLLIAMSIDRPDAAVMYSNYRPITFDMHHTYQYGGHFDEVSIFPSQYEYFKGVSYFTQNYSKVRGVNLRLSDYADRFPYYLVGERFNRFTLEFAPTKYPVGHPVNRYRYFSGWLPCAPHVQVLTVKYLNTNPDIQFINLNLKYFRLLRSFTLEVKGMTESVFLRWPREVDSTVQRFVYVGSDCCPTGGNSTLLLQILERTPHLTCLEMKMPYKDFALFVRAIITLKFRLCYIQRLVLNIPCKSEMDRIMLTSGVTILVKNFPKISQVVIMSNPSVARALQTLYLFKDIAVKMESPKSYFMDSVCENYEAVVE